MPSQRANRLKELREERGWSMDELAQACSPKTTASTINKLEKGKQQLTMAWIYRLAEALGLHPLEILEPLPKLAPEELRLVDVARGLSEEDRSALYRVAEAMRQKPH